LLLLPWEDSCCPSPYLLPRIHSFFLVKRGSTSYNVLGYECNIPEHHRPPQTAWGGCFPSRGLDHKTSLETMESWNGMSISCITLGHTSKTLSRPRGLPLTPTGAGYDRKNTIYTWGDQGSRQSVREHSKRKKNTIPKGTYKKAVPRWVSRKYPHLDFFSGAERRNSGEMATLSVVE